MNAEIGAGTSQVATPHLSKQATNMSHNFLTGMIGAPGRTRNRSGRAKRVAALPEDGRTRPARVLDPISSANRIVGRGRKAAIEDVVGRVAERFNPPSKRRRELSVDEETQSCAPQHG